MRSMTLMRSVVGSAAALLVAGAVAAQAATPAATPAKAAAPAQPAASKTIRVLVAADQESVLASQMAGRIDQLNVRLGSPIKAGQVLIRFNCEEQDAHLKMANSDFYSAQQTYESKVKLQSMQSVAEIDVQQAGAAAQKAKAQIQLYQAQLKQCNIVAPFAGTVTRLLAKQYASVNIGQPLIEIVNDRKLKVQLNVPSLWLSWLKAGQPFSVQIDETGKAYQAKVARINGRVDAVSQSIEIEGEVIGNTANLLPGMSGVASFAAPR
ncbi:efflux RND transporter periplasmic adaptor subunit [Janthinobacterium aquaticum]|uniref:efflux RND transporter periplasmic adaptor subunit n=1 Tax=Janthinobacterium sp. FT58W TaxID=2654254 RepID=UPI00186B303A|nr:efflux RND transporter periplasmic adaptor subunit [Janthinobacterium sp. FT58W]